MHKKYNEIHQDVVEEKKKAKAELQQKMNIVTNKVNIFGAAT